MEHDLVEEQAPPPPPATARRAGGIREISKPPADTSPIFRLRQPAAGTRDFRARGAPFVEHEDPRYAWDGFWGKFGALIRQPRPFNPLPAMTAATDLPLSLYLFGDWGTGLALARAVTDRIAGQLRQLDGARQAHAIHLGDVYYAGCPDEYESRMVPLWPVPDERREEIGSWSLNGNHDMYSGGHGYFDTMLRKRALLRWHADGNGAPSSFFLIENQDWQVFGLDTAWNLPSFSGAVLGRPTLKDYGGQNGRLTRGQVEWMAARRDDRKGCILLTHHQPASSRSDEGQHSRHAINMLRAAGIYHRIDAWIWGHEHRCVVFKPKAERVNPVLRIAPQFCACLGNGGVPVPEKNFHADKQIADVLWEEDRFDPRLAIYDKRPVLPFGFGRIDTQPGSFDFRAFDHTGRERFACHVLRATRPIL